MVLISGQIAVERIVGPLPRLLVAVGRRAAADSAGGRRPAPRGGRVARETCECRATGIADRGGGGTMSSGGRP